MGMLAVTGYILACLQLANSKIYQGGFPPMQISIVGTTFAKYLSLQNVIFPVKMSPIHKVWSWSSWIQGFTLIGVLTFRTPNCKVETTFAKCLSLWNAIFSVKMAPYPQSLELESLRTVGHPDHMSTEPVPWPCPTLTTPIPVVW